MSYINGETVLPDQLVKEIQKYIDGEYIYIPKRSENRKTWGSSTDTRKVMDERNASIFHDYQCGQSVKILAQRYFLSEKSIHRIVLGQRKKCG